MTEQQKAIQPLQNHQVTFIDTGLPDYQILIDGLPEGMEVVLVAPDQDGIQVMAEWAQNHADYSAIHILGHGSNGAQQLGSATLSSETLSQYKTQFRQIGASLNEDGDILLYGCHVAADQTGVEFIGKLAQITGADIAASDNLTGAESLGGDWELETVSGLQDKLSLSFERFAGSLAQQTIDMTAQGDHGPDENFTVFGVNLSVSTNFTFDWGTGSEGNNTYTDAQVQVIGGGAIAPYVASDGGVFNDVSGGFEVAASNSYGVDSLTLYRRAQSIDGPNNDDFTIVGIKNGVSVIQDTLTFGTAFGANETELFTRGSGTWQDSTLWSDIDKLVVYWSTAPDNDGVGVRGTQDFQELALVNMTVSDPVSADTSPPTFDSTPSIGNVASSTVDLAVDINESGKVYYVVVADGAAAPTAAEVKAGTASGGTGAVTSGSQTLSSGDFSHTFNLTGLSASTAYDIYIVAEDDESSLNIQATATKVDIITVAPPNAVPTIIGAPSDLTVTEDSVSNIDLSSVTFADVNGDKLTVTLTVSAGTFATPADGSSAGAGVVETLNSDAGSNIITLEGSAADINTYLDTAANIQYTGAANANGENAATITISASDGNGGNLASNPAINLDITAVNDAPTATNLTQTAKYNDNDSSVALEDIVVTDPDGSDTVTATLTLSNTSAGTLTTGTYGLATSTYNAGSGVWTVTGSVTETNAALAAVAFSPAAGWSQDTSITTRIRDAADTGPADGTITLDVTDVTAPTVSSITRVSPVSETTNADSVTWRVTFSENVQSLDVTDFALSGSTATVTDVSAAEGGGFDVTASGGDLVGLDATVTLSFAGEQNITDTSSNALVSTTPTGTNNNTYILDNSGPVFNGVGSSPTDDGLVTDLAGNLVLDFSENIRLGSGFITIRNTTDSQAHTTVESIDVTAGEGAVTVQDDKLIINPTANLTAGSTYYIAIDNTAIDDVHGNSFAGVSDNTVFNFSTAPLVALSIDKSSIAEAGGTATVTVSLKDALGNAATAVGDVTVLLGQGQGTATLGDDYAGTPSIITISKGSSSNTFTVTGISDVLDDNTEIISIPIVSVTNGFEDGSQSVSITLVENAPSVVDLNGGEAGENFSATFTEDGSAANVAAIAGATITDADGDNIQSMTVTLTNRFDGNDTESLSLNSTAQTAAIGLTVTYTSSTGVLNINGAASAATYQQILRGVVYNNTSQSPDDTSRQIEIVVNDGASNSTTRTAAIAVDAVNDAPVLDAGQSPTLVAIDEDSSAPANGSTAGSTLVSALASGISDVDTGAAQGIAVTGTNGVEGSLWYSTDNGTTWTQGPSVSANSALLLNATARLYWQPGANKNGTANDAVSFRAWDQSSGSNGGTADTSSNGGTSAFSTITDTVAVMVNAVNDAPTGEITLSGNAQVGSTLSVVTENLVDVDGVGTFAYVWKADGNVIADETAATLTLTNDLLGAEITVTVQYTDKGNSAETVTSSATAAVQSPPPPPPAGDNVDGAEVTESTGTAPDGTSVNVTDIGTVTENRDEDTGDTELANVPLVASDNGTVLEVGLPTGVGMRVESGSAGSAGGASGLLAAIRSRTNTPEQQGDRDEMTGAGGGFLQDLPDPDNLVVRTLVPTVPANTTTGPANPILVSAAPAQPGTPSVALVIDTRNLPSGTVIQLENVQFAAVVGDVRMTGGSGSQVVSGDSGNQIIVLGEDDDVLRGGAGDDLIGSRDGVDRLYGDSGNDWLVGGAGDDILAGGTGNDVLQGGASDAGQWQFRLVDGELMSEFTASEAIAADAATVTHVGPWWADGVATRDSDGRLAFSYAASDRLELVATLYKAATGDRAQLMDFNTFVNSGLTAEELAQEAVTFFFDSQGPLPQALEVQVSLLIEAVWGEGSASEALISEGVNFLNAGGSWGGAMLLLAKAQEAEQLLSNDAGDLILVSDYQTSEAGWSAGSGEDILRGGAGNDRLVGGDGNDLLDGGEGTDVAVFTGGLQDFWLQRHLREDGGEQLVLTRKLSGETDTLIDIELLKVGGHYFGAADTLSGIDVGTQVDLGDHVIQLTAQQVQAMDLTGIY